MEDKMFFFNFNDPQSEKEIFDFCVDRYNKYFDSKRDDLEITAKEESRTGQITDKKKEEIETTAQLNAIKETLIEGRKIYPTKIPLLWESIYKAHLYRKTGLKDFTVIQNVITAAQSWRSSSGHAFESIVTELGTLCLKNAGPSNVKIRYILQKELNTLLKANEISNSPTDRAWLEKQVKGSVFDVYVIAEVTEHEETKTYCFGCVQCKTSIRDRVSRDIVPSREAMESKFWSIGFVLDGTMFSTPKYKNMVNGKIDTEFKTNGWHGIYVLSYEETDDRIYAVDIDFDIVKEHTLQAFNQWYYDRMGFTPSWKAS